MPRATWTVNALVPGLVLKPRHSTPTRPRPGRHIHIATDQPGALHVLVTHRHLDYRVDVNTGCMSLLHQRLEFATERRVIGCALVKQYCELAHARRAVRSILDTLQRRLARLIIRTRKALPQSTNHTSQHALAVLHDVILCAVQRLCNQGRHYHTQRHWLHTNLPNRSEYMNQASHTRHEKISLSFL